MEESSFYAGVRIGGELPPSIVRDHPQIEDMRLNHMMRFRGLNGPVHQAWWWALTRAVVSPITMQTPTGEAPSRAEIVKEMKATGPDIVSTQEDEQIELARRVLSWLIGETEEPPV
jgi:hypothetical protein